MHRRVFQGVQSHVGAGVTGGAGTLLAAFDFRRRHDVARFRSVLFHLVNNARLGHDNVLTLGITILNRF